MTVVYQRGTTREHKRGRQEPHFGSIHQEGEY